MSFLLEFADSHVGNRWTIVWDFWMSQVISQEASLLELINEVLKQMLLINTIFPRDDYVHISTKTFPSSVGTTNLHSI
jgi:hypothetical protein